MKTKFKMALDDIEEELEIVFDYQPYEASSAWYPGCEEMVEPFSVDRVNGEPLTKEEEAELLNDRRVIEACWEAVKNGK